MNKHESSKAKKIVYRFITIVCLGVFIYAGYGLVDIFIDYNQNKKVAKEVQSTYYNTPSASAEKPTNNSEQTNTIKNKFANLKEDNEDVVGWISIDDTKIDYPILQSEDNMDYLTQDFYKEESIGGSIFLDYRNNVETMSRNTVVYGHRMKDGSMFQHLTKFLDEEFYQSHQTFEVETLYNTYEAEIFSVYNTTTDFNYIETDFETDQEYEEFLIDVRQESMYETDVEVDITDQIVTLSTCDYELDENEGRLVVQAKLTKK